jgi:hypothetical protein
MWQDIQLDMVPRGIGQDRTYPLFGNNLNLFPDFPPMQKHQATTTLQRKMSS